MGNLNLDWKTRNLVLAGNFNMTNVDELFEQLVDLGQHPKQMADTVTILEKIGHFLDEANDNIYYKNREEIISKGNTVIHVNNEYVINTSDIIYSKKENIIRSENLVTLEDNFQNKFIAEDFTFLVLVVKNAPKAI